MSLVGIIANPASGKDIRRVVAQATVVHNHEKVSILRRVLLALHACGVQRAAIMPDQFGIGARALDGLRDRPAIGEMASLLDMPIQGTAADSLRAAEMLRDAGAGCLVVLGGDGTCRAVAKGCGAVPVLALSTGTNNVVPCFVESTVAGMAAAHVARQGAAAREPCCRRHKRLLVHVDGVPVDQALVEVALVASGFLGARAVWEGDRLRRIWVSRAQPVNIGLSAVVGMVRPVDPDEPAGACVSLAPAGRPVLAPIAPGLLATLHIGEVIDLAPGAASAVPDERPAVLALDGEREIVLQAGERATVTLDLDGPWFVDVAQTLHAHVREISSQ